MYSEFDFNDLFVLDLANNHQGDAEHGLAIIRGAAEIVNKHGVRAGIKFQFRQLETFIHPAHRDATGNKHIPRFLSTRLAKEQYARLLEEVRSQGLLAICTPFDEASVDLIVDMDFDIIKVASCSAADWPLLDAVAESNLPVVFSTGGLDSADVDKLVSFFDHRAVDFAVMHCVSIYPTPDDQCFLGAIDGFRKRYPGRVVGWSTHEAPDNMAPIMVAVAKGARMFERHIGLATAAFPLNAYSSTPPQLDGWLAAYRQAMAICGGGDAMPARPAVEVDAIRDLQRGVYLTRSAKAGARLTRAHVTFAMPCLPGQLPSGKWKDDMRLTRPLQRDAAIMEADTDVPAPTADAYVKEAIHDVKALLNEAGVPLNSDFEIEYSHHHGLENFRRTGCVIINCINRDYCKKVLVQLPGQAHPLHYHRLKEETFQVLSGILEVEVDGHRKTLYPGQTCLIQPGVFHRFWTATGCVFEELSTTHYNDDSYYKDKRINRIALAERKTVVDHWGRFQLPLQARRKA